MKTTTPVFGPHTLKETTRRAWALVAKLDVTLWKVFPPGVDYVAMRAQCVAATREARRLQAMVMS